MECGLWGVAGFKSSLSARTPSGTAGAGSLFVEKGEAGVEGLRSELIE